MKTQKTIKWGNKLIICTITRKNVKRLRIRIDKNGEVHVSAPLYMSDTRIDDFILSDMAFIVAAVEKVESEKLVSPTPTRYAQGERVCVFGNIKTLYIVEGKKNFCFEDGDRLILSVKDVTDEKLRQKTFISFARKQVEFAVGSFCEKYYPVFCHKVRVFPKLKFRNMTSRWGSCTPSKNSMTFNYALFAAHVKCVEYVVVHELTHFLQQNHSRSFYSELKKVMPDYEVWRKKLMKTAVNKY